MSIFKQKRKRITLTVTENVDFKIKQLEQVLGVTKFDKKWNDICNDAKKLTF